MRKFLTVVGVSVVYLLLGSLSRQVSSFDGTISVFWLPAGWALFSAWRWGYSSALAVMVAQLAIGLGFSGEPYPVATTLCYVVGNGLATCFLAWRFSLSARANPFAETVLMARFLALLFFSDLINASFGMLGLYLGGIAPLAAAPNIIWNWWGGDVGGALALAPVLIAFDLHRSAPRSDAVGARWAIASAIAATAIVVGLFVLAGPTLPQTLIFLVLPPLLWLSFRHDERITTLVLLVTTLIAAAATVRGIGPLGAVDPVASLLQLQIFIIVLALTLLLVVAANNERRQLVTKLASETVALEDRVRQRTADISLSNASLLQINEERNTLLVELQQTKRELELSLVAMERLASNDVVTGLMNRRRLMERLEEECARGRRFHQALALIMIDLDNFKMINDRWGHAAGDTVLANTGRLILESLRETDCAGRYGGEELCLLLPNTDADGALKVADMLRAQIELLASAVTGEPGYVTGSFGVAVAIIDDEFTPESLLSRADTMMYQAKALGRNRAILALPSV